MGREGTSFPLSFLYEAVSPSRRFVLPLRFSLFLLEVLDPKEAEPFFVKLIQISEMLDSNKSSGWKRGSPSQNGRSSVSVLWF